MGVSSISLVCISIAYLYGGVECLRARYVVHDQCTKCALEVHLVGSYRRHKVNGLRTNDNCSLRYPRAVKHSNFVKALCLAAWELCPYTAGLAKLSWYRSHALEFEIKRPNRHMWHATLTQHDAQSAESVKYGIFYLFCVQAAGE